MFCSKCGKQIDDNSEFCVFCGAKIFEQKEISSADNCGVVPTEKNKEQINCISDGKELAEKTKNHGKPSKPLIIGMASGCLLLLLIIIGGVNYVSHTGYGTPIQNGNSDPGLSGMFVELQKIYDNGNLVVYATGMSYENSTGFYKISMYIENHNLMEVSYVATDTKINGIEVSPYTVVYMPTVHGLGANDLMPLAVKKEKIEEIGINKINTISFSLSDGKKKTGEMTINVSSN